MVRAAAEQALVGLFAHPEGARQNTEQRQEQGEMPVLDVDPLHENRYINQYIATVYIYFRRKLRFEKIEMCRVWFDSRIRPLRCARYWFR